MKYRIKIRTFKNGRKEYIPEVKWFIFWRYLSYRGEIVPIEYEVRTREEALNSIDLHFKGNTNIQSITFEYISK